MPKALTEPEEAMVDAEPKDQTSANSVHENTGKGGAGNEKNNEVDEECSLQGGSESNNASLSPLNDNESIRHRLSSSHDDVIAESGSKDDDVPVCNISYRQMR